MRTGLFAVVLAGLAWGMAQSPFVDVSPCHWATEAVNKISGTPQVDVEQARASTYLAENALRQVFEGLRCGNAVWSAKFISDTSEDALPLAGVTSFNLQPLGTDLGGERGSLRFSLTATIDGEAFSRQGTVDLVFLEQRWQVTYPSLVALDLPVFP
jgi:hypothetical protein